MRLNAITVRNFRGVDDVTMTFPASGVTIVEGDNEVGKSSLFEALDLVLAERDDASKQKVRAVRPVGRDVGSEVNVDITSGQYRFRYFKRWHSNRKTELEIIEPSREKLAGRQAHDRVMAILDETLDSNLWEALRVRQGRELDQAGFAGGSLGRALDLAAGGDVAGDREDDLWARVTAERDRYWTKTGQPKADRTARARAVEDARKGVDQLEAALESLQHDADLVERLVDERRDLDVKSSQNQQELAGLSERFEAIEEYRREIDRLTQAASTAQVVQEKASEVSDRRAELIERADADRREVNEFERQMEAVAPNLAAARANLGRIEGEVADTRTQFDELTDAHRQSVKDRDYRRQQIELEQLSERLQRVAAALRDRRKALATLDAIQVDAANLEAIEQAALGVVKAEAMAQNQAASVLVEAEAEVQFHVDSEGYSLEVGETREVRVSQSATIAVPGVVRLTITAGAEAKALAEDRESARDDLARLCAELGVQDLADARRQATSRAEAERTVRDADSDIKRDLRDLTMDELSQKVGRIRARTEAFGADRGADPPLPKDLKEAQAAESSLEQTLEAQRDLLAQLQHRLDDARAEVQRAEVERVELAARLDQAKIAAQDSSTTLQLSRADASDEHIAQEVERSRAAADACQGELKQAEGKLRQKDPATIEALLTNSKAVKQRLNAQLLENDRRTRDLRTKLAVKGEEGLAEELDTAKSKLVQLELEQSGLESRASAAMLLYEALDKRRSEAHNRYVSPFRERIEQLGRLVFGEDLEVELDETLRVAKRTLKGETLGFGDLSSGAKEQLGIISRLACASIIADEGGAPVVFDDALGWSDPSRLGRMGAVISVAGRSCQVIVLTCTPGRYEGVGDATVVRMPA